jgi:predicted ester cyclase
MLFSYTGYRVTRPNNDNVRIEREFVMSVEQIARDFITKMNDVNAAESYLTADAVAAGGVLPQPIPAREAIRLRSALNSAFPDLKFDIQNVTVEGNQATVQAIWSGTNNGPLNMPLPGMQSIPPTGKQVSVKDTYIVTVQGDKVSRIEVNSPPDGGIPAALGQIGVAVPGM